MAIILQHVLYCILSLKKLHAYIILAILYILYTYIHTHIFVENKQLRYFIPKAYIFLEQAHSPI